MADEAALRPGTAAEVIAAQFPALGGQEVSPMASGWDHELFAVGEEWVFRFPRRGDRVPWLMREREILDIAGETLNRSVPRFELIGRPSPAFPYPFVGYRRLVGVGATRCAPRDLPTLARDVGKLLTQLHRVDPDRIPPTPDGWEHETWATLRDDLADIADLVRPLLPDDLGASAEPYLRGSVPEPAPSVVRRLIHNDISPDHLIIDPQSGRLVGLVDFTDAMVGDPVLDMAGLIGIDGYRFIDAVLTGYGLALGDDFGPKLRWVTRTLTLTWLAEASRQDPGALATRLRWVAHAFA